MTRSVKAKTKRGKPHALFAELSEGMEALAEARQGKVFLCPSKSPGKDDQKENIFSETARGQESDLVLLVRSNSQHLVCSLLNAWPHHRADGFFDRTGVDEFALWH